MISLLRGIIADKSIGRIVIDVQGVGYGVTVPLSTYYRLPDAGSETELKIYTHVKDDSIELVGFLTEDEKSIFTMLLSVSGVGPRGATNILSNISPRELVSAISSGDLIRRKVPGVGPKLASRLTTELKDKFSSFRILERYQDDDGNLDAIISALLNLGYTRIEIDEQIIKIEEIAGKEKDMEIALRESLRLMRKE